MKSKGIFKKRPLSFLLPLPHDRKGGKTAVFIVSLSSWQKKIKKCFTKR